MPVLAAQCVLHVLPAQYVPHVLPAQCVLHVLPARAVCSLVAESLAMLPLEEQQGDNAASDSDEEERPGSSMPGTRPGTRPCSHAGKVEGCRR